MVFNKGGTTIGSGLPPLATQATNELVAAAADAVAAFYSVAENINCVKNCYISQKTTLLPRLQASMCMSRAACVHERARCARASSCS